MADVLEVRDLCIRFGAIEILHCLTFSVARGSSLAIIGPNGAGKTVLLKALIGALPYTGSIRWSAGARLGYVPQKLDLERDLPLNGWDFLRAKAALSKASGAQIAQALTAVALQQHTLAQPLGSLSGGQFQRLLVALALLGRPSVLLLDEPAAGVDAPGQARLGEVIHALQSTDDLTVLLVSHDLSVVYQYADNVLCLGTRDSCFGPPRSALTPEVLYELYGARTGFHVHGAS